MREPTQTRGRLANLSADESALYTDLVEDSLGPADRLEQERVSFVQLQRALGTGC